MSLKIARHRHAGALALLAWALIFPPMVGDRVDIGAPVNEWDVVHKGFVTIRDCEQFREHLHGYANLTEVLNNPKELAAIKAFPERRDAARCTPVDDPQRKSK